MTITVNLELGKRETENFQELEETIYRTVLQFGREIAAKALESLDEQMLNSRDASRFRCKGFQKTCIKTIMGAVEFERRVYVDNAAVEGAHCVHLLDEALELNQIGLVTENVCKLAATAACETTYRAVAKTITEATGLSISAQKEMKVGIAYPGVRWMPCGITKRRILDNKVAYATFDQVSAFRKYKEGLVASRFDVKGIDLRIVNGDGAQWIQKKNGVKTIPVLDKYHRNKKITECVADKDLADNLRKLLYAGEIDLLLTVIEAQINSLLPEENQKEIDKLTDLWLLLRKQRCLVRSVQARH